jgi:hypothetical protein
LLTWIIVVGLIIDHAVPSAFRERFAQPEKIWDILVGD